MRVIYCAREKSTGKFYVGATGKGLMERKNDHLYKAMRGSQLDFHKKIRDNGVNSFSWVVLGTARNKNELAEKEKFFITKYDSFKNGYNNDSGGGFKKWVYQYDKLGSLIGAYPNLNSAAKLNRGKAKSISNCCLGNSKSYMNFYWSYTKYKEFPLTSNQNNKRVIQINDNDEIIAIYDSVVEASKHTGLSKTCISRCCRGEREHSRGFKWKYQ